MPGLQVSDVLRSRAVCALQFGTDRAVLMPGLVSGTQLQVLTTSKCCAAWMLRNVFTSASVQARTGLDEFRSLSRLPSGRWSICREGRTWRSRLKQLPEDWPAERRTEDWLHDALRVRFCLCCAAAALLLHFRRTCRQ